MQGVTTDVNHATTILEETPVATADLGDHVRAENIRLLAADWKLLQYSNISTYLLITFLQEMLELESSQSMIEVLYDLCQ